MIEHEIPDDDIEQVSKDFQDFGIPLGAIDTQNRIWLKIITKELKSNDNKRQFLKNHNVMRPKEDENELPQIDSSGDA